MVRTPFPSRPPPASLNRYFPFAGRPADEVIKVSNGANAVKFTPAGGSLKLEATAAPDGTIAIVVSGTEIGIPADDLDRIFETFRRGEASV